MCLYELLDKSLEASGQITLPGVTVADLTNLSGSITTCQHCHGNFRIDTLKGVFMGHGNINNQLVDIIKTDDKHSVRCVHCGNKIDVLSFPCTWQLGPLYREEGVQ